MPDSIINKEIEVGTELAVPELGVIVRLDGHSKGKKLRILITRTPKKNGPSRKPLTHRRKRA